MRSTNGLIFARKTASLTIEYKVVYSRSHTPLSQILDLAENDFNYRFSCLRVNDEEEQSL